MEERKNVVLIDCFKILGKNRRVRIVYRGLGRAFVVHMNRDLEVNNFLTALGLVCS